MAHDRKHSILVVDDENSNIMELSHILSQDYVVYAAKSGCRALSAAEKHTPDVIMLDIVMPEMDGYAVISVLKSSENTQNIPVIFITGSDGTEDEEKGLALGAADYVSKPFSELIVKLRVENQLKILEQSRTIERLSITDQLTDLPNRRCFNDRLQMEWGKSMREQTPLSVLMIDIDRLKSFNDAYGHHQGDVALQTVSKTLTGELKRLGDFVARWGGGEFAVLLPNTDFDGARIVSEQIRKCIEDMEIPHADGTKTIITVSIGVNTEVPLRNSSYDGFISNAGKALIRAKTMGRNNVCAHSSAE